MCGIAGFTSLDHPAPQGRIRKVIGTILHRGPDQQGVYESPLLSMGTARLRIIDLEGGDQPISTEDGQTVICFNGEIYNFAGIRDELEAKGHAFRTHSDTETILRGFVEWDTRVFAKLRGMFAIALWQPALKRLVLARDRMGIKPLYISHRGRDLYFGSELKTLFEHPEISRTLDRNGLNYYLSLNWVPAPYTLVEGIEKLWPGELLEWRNGEIHREPYWALKFDVNSQWTLDSAKEALDGLLRDSVKEHLISDVPLGVWASGGLDSSAIVHYAAEAYPGKLKTFSVSFRGRNFDESAYFRQIARQYDTDHHEFDLSEKEDLPDTISKIPQYCDEPSADAGALPVWFLSRMSRRHVTVALSGEGADELFAGYYTYIADGLAPRLRRIPPILRRAGLALLRPWPVSDDKISLEYKVRRFLEGSLLPPADAHLFWNGTFSESKKKALLRDGRTAAPGRLVNTLPTESFQLGMLNQYLWLDQKYYLSDDILIKCDRMSMAHSLEVRPPFLDHRLVEFANSLPAELKLNGSTLKFVLRELMKDKLPPAVIRRRKEGFDIPTHHWFRGPLQPLLLDTITPQAVESAGVFQPSEVQRLIESHLRRKANFGYPLWGLLMLFLWMKRWKIHGAN